MSEVIFKHVMRNRKTEKGKKRKGTRFLSWLRSKYTPLFILWLSTSGGGGLFKVSEQKLFVVGEFQKIEKSTFENRFLPEGGGVFTTNSTMSKYKYHLMSCNFFSQIEIRHIWLMNNWNFRWGCLNVKSKQGRKVVGRPSSRTVLPCSDKISEINYS